ncbi:MAG: diguanylate cyclase [Erysipelotrichales bacterium]|nr:MAG: diguanylate cyclase [Erysipelotrichales bacterium]
MDIAQTVFYLLLTCALFLGLFNASSLIYKRKSGRMFPVFVLNICLFIIAFGYLMAQNASSLQSMENWDRVKLVGLLMFPAVWGFSALDLTRRSFRFRRTIVSGLAILSLVFIGLRFTDAGYALFYTSVKHVQGSLIGGLVGNKGPAYAYFLIYAATIYFLAFMAYLGAAVRYIKKLRNLYIRCLLIALIPAAGLVLDIVNPAGTGFDFLSVSAMLSIIGLSFLILQSELKSTSTQAQALLFQHNDDPMIVTDEAGRLLDFNLAAERLFPELDHVSAGRPLQDILIQGKPLFQRVDHPMKPDFEVKRDEETYIYEIQSLPIADAWRRSGGRILRFNDITQKRKESDAFHRLATRDSLTGLLNRRQFLSLAKLSFDRNAIDGSGLAVILFDLDHFKSINDIHGPAGGDEVLRTVGNLFLGHFRKSDLVGRIGGEEFAVLLPSTQAGDAIKLAEKFCVKVREAAIVHADTTIRLTLSAGVAATSTEEENLDQILKSADMALRESKEKGRDRVSVSKKSEALK